MCSNPEKSAAAAMAAIQPVLVVFMGFENVSQTQQTEVITAYDAAEAAVAAWTPGTTAQTVVEAVNAADALFQALPVPPEDKILAGIIAAGFTGVVAILEVNAASDKVAQHELTYAAVVKVNEQAPGVFKYHKGIFAEFEASPAKQITDGWNKQVEELGGKYLVLKVSPEA